MTQISCGAAPGPTKGVDQIVTILSISPAETDHAALQAIVEGPSGSDAPFQWSLQRSTGVAAALAILREERIPIVICERDLGQQTWRDILEGVAELPEPPCLVVASRVADNYLWAEALNLGAYDVLAKPFDCEEVLRTLRSAWRRWAN